ncbi:uncharacterized protein [Dermacentor andersoni]|uniref:uncharacterized protein isoform X2 n=1 Tax=Dermacentor andersoni TaxID=34620 RepID=UPI002155785D|nr:uncharacterized protein LOC126536863 isoform X2 [Dermacentor andersoni]
MEATSKRKTRRKKVPFITGRDILLCVAGMAAMSAIAVVFFFAGTEHNKRQLRHKAAPDAHENAVPLPPSAPATSPPKPPIISAGPVMTTLRRSLRKARHHAKLSKGARKLKTKPGRKKPAKLTPTTKKRPRDATKRATTRVRAERRKASAARTTAGAEAVMSKEAEE